MKEPIYEGERMISFSDFCFFPKQVSIKEALAALAEKEYSKDIQKILDAENELPFPEAHIEGFNAYILLKEKYMHCRWNNFTLKEPAWVELLPKKLHRHLNHEYEFSHANIYKYVGLLPYTKIVYGCTEGGIVHHLHDVFNLHRLYSVRQLGFLIFPLKPNVITMPIPHSRGLHHLDTAAVGLSIVRNNYELQEHENTLEAALCSHDACTPAGSDTTKYIDRKAFDEELNFNVLFQNPGWNIIRDVYGIDEKLLYDTVCGIGIYGEVLDIADKIAYTARDAAYFIGSRIGAEYRSGDIELFQKARQIMRETPDFLSLWNDILIHKGDMVFTNPKALARFLQIRAIMTAELYKKGSARIVENVLARKLIKIPYDAGEITAKDLLSWNDATLEQFLRNKYGISFILNSFNRSLCKNFESESARNEFMKHVPEDMIPIIDDFAPNSHSGTEKFKTLNGGKVKVFAEAFPEASKEIDSIINQRPSGFPLYLIARDDLSINENAWKIIKNS